MNFASVKGIAIPQGNASKLSIGGVDVWSAGRLPSGYQEVEYLKGNGATTYINMGDIDITNSPYVRLVCEYQAYSSDTNAFGCVRTVRFEHGIGWNGESFSYNFGNGYGNKLVYLQDGTKIRASSLAGTRLVFEYRPNEFYLNGVPQHKSEMQRYATGTLGVATGVWLFGTDRGNAKRYFNGKIFAFSVYNQRDLVPCIRKSDNKPGMYDLCGSICPLTGTPFYINAGTGDFITGEPV